MYIISKNNVITMTRGDSFRMPIKLVTGCFPNQTIYELEDDDIAYFAITAPRQHFENAIIKKKFTGEDEDENGIINVELKPEDTWDLCPGTYHYSVKVLYKTGDDTNPRIDTIIPSTKINIID